MGRSDKEDAARATQETAAQPGGEALYTRYCAAPEPAHPVREPRFVRALQLVTWLGRVILPFPHPRRRATAGHRH